jgi:hypothetical protein
MNLKNTYIQVSFVILERLPRPGVISASRVSNTDGVHRLDAVINSRASKWFRQKIKKIGAFHLERRESKPKA